MGQKVNPHGFRVGVIKDWNSRWFTKDENFGDTLVSDYKVRTYLKEKYKEAGVPVEEIWVCGGIANKNPLMMQLYADVLEQTLYVSDCTQACALGSAVYAAAAAGVGNIFETVEAMGSRSCKVYTPDSASFPTYRKLYGEYKRLHDYFGKGENAVMERLRSIAREAW